VLAVANSRVSAGPGTLTFSSAGSTSFNGVVLTYFWTFGDGGFSSEANPVHAYATSGSYSAQLFVSDGLTTASAKLRVTIPSQ
jgi:PKD repeat protein